MKCPYCEKTNLIILNANSKDYVRGYNHKCMKCHLFFSIVSESF